MRIPLVNVKRQTQALRAEMQAAIDGVLDRGDFILGQEVSAFEREFAQYCGAKHCVGVGCGLDALTLILKESDIGPGHEVITVANTFIATALAVQHVGATPVVVDCDPESFNIDPEKIREAITLRTKAIIPVHLYGQPAPMHAIGSIASEFDLKVIEDACQAHGAEYDGIRTGALGNAAAFSFYPGKNLGGIGDGGAIVTNDDALVDRLRASRNYGSTRKYHHPTRGFNTRLDSVQAAVLRVKLQHLDRWNARRRELADRYRDLLEDANLILPAEQPDGRHVYHLFVVRCGDRDQVAARMKEQGIETGIHYPVAMHEQESFRGLGRVAGDLRHSIQACGEILSLPLCPFTTDDEADEVADSLRQWAEKSEPAAFMVGCS
jgi:dTDP-4-amino-4,6-dideoxygalactose transaminase